MVMRRLLAAIFHHDVRLFRERTTRRGAAKISSERASERKGFECDVVATSLLHPQAKKTAQRRYDRGRTYADGRTYTERIIEVNQTCFIQRKASSKVGFLLDANTSMNMTTHYKRVLSIELH